MKISLVDVDGHNFPNLALMKLSAWHKAQGDAVEWYSPLFSKPDRIYASKVFTFTPDFTDYAAGDPEPVRGGTGYDPAVRLPDEVERTLPDYSIYPDFPAALGFLARGCIRKCPWCIVPEKEGALKVVGDIERIAAAPEMYEALADIAENCWNHGCSETCAEADCKICEILKKARGEA